MRGIRLRFMLAILAAAAMLAGTPARAQGRLPAGYEQPAMPLAEALRRFARATGNDVVFKEDMVRGLQARAVRNAGDPYDALRQMLSGTGLASRFTRRDAFILEFEGRGERPDLALDRIEIAALSPAERQSAYRWYGEKLLNACLDSLRRSGDLGRRSYEFTVYVWLSDAGRVIDLAGIEGATEDEIVGIARQALTGLDVGSIPPANMPQPVGLRIVAR